ncbi:MAG: tetratricopeptide repeat protein [Candidatus Omnitrophica bacterium]|nr:tetratricopeptide repeat protein [Candidatus Omnitrophota bacterium]
MIKKGALNVFRNVFSACLAFLFLFGPAALGDIIKLKNGNAMETKILKEDEDFVTVQAPGGKVKIPKNEIKSIWRGSKEELVEVRGKEVFLKNGVRLYNEGRFQEAAEAFERVGTGTALIHANLGSVYATLGERQKAEENFLKALEKDPENFDNNLNAAQFFKDSRDFQRAVLFYEKAHAQKPGDRRIRKNLAYCFYQLGDYAKAADLFEALGRENDPLSLYNAALCYFKMGRAEEAALFAKELVEAPLPPPEAFLLGAEIRKEQGRLDEAAKEYENLLERHPGSAAALTGLGALYLEMKKDREALDKFSEVLTRAPDDFSANCGAARASLALGAFADAELYYKKALTLKPDDPSLLNGLGILYLKTAEPTKALEAFRQALQRNSEYVPARSNAGLAYALMNDAENALREWDRALEMDPRLEPALRNKKLLEEALQGRPDDGKN